MSKEIEKNYHQILTRINTAHSNLAETSSDILEFMIDIFGADKAEITIYREEFDINTFKLTEEAAVKLRIRRGYSDEQWSTLEESGVLLKSIRFALEQKESKVITDTRKEEGEARKLSEFLQNGSWMNYILIMGEKVMANLHLAKKEFGYYKKKDLKRLEYLSMLLATAINLSLLWERERKLMINFIQSLNKALEVRDEYTAGHVERVSFYSRELARKIGMDDTDIEDVETAAILHDIGKIGICDSVLKKKAGLSWEEKEVIRKHVPLTDEIFENLHHLDNARKIARYHHETFDGKGYIMGLKGEEIPTGSKILAIADAFDAMTSDRPYRKAFFVEEALGILRDPNITQWDKKLINLFVEYLHSDTFLRQAEDRGMIRYLDKDRILYDSNTSILRFKDLSRFFRGTSLESRYKKTKKMSHEEKFDITHVQAVKAR